MAEDSASSRSGRGASSGINQVPSYEPLPETELKKEIEDCHRQLIEALDKPERRLVLQIIDDKDQIAENRSIDSFIAGFRLAWTLGNELNMYEQTHPTQ